MATPKKKVKKTAKSSKKPIAKKKTLPKAKSKAKPKKTVSRIKAPVKAKKATKKRGVSKKKPIPTKKVIKPKVAKMKKAKPITRKLSITELFNNVHKQLLEEQQNLRHLEHHPHNLNKGFNAQKNGFQMSRMSRNMNFGRGKK